MSAAVAHHAWEELWLLVLGLWNVLIQVTEPVCTHTHKCMTSIHPLLQGGLPSSIAVLVPGVTAILSELLLHHC